MNVQHPPRSAQGVPGPPHRLRRPASLAVVTAAAIGSLLAACLPAGPVAQAAPAATFDVRLVLPGPAADGGQSEAMASSLNRLVEAGSINTVEVHESVTVEAATASLADVSGFDLVVVHGSGYAAALAAAATANPDARFAWAASVDAPDFDQIAALPNVATITATADGGAFVLGTVAARISRDLPVVFAGGAESGVEELFAEGFAAGVRYVDEGADVGAQFAAGGPTSLDGVGVLATSSLDGVVAAGSAGVPVFYVGFDRNAITPWVVASQVYRYDPALAPVIASIAAGSFAAGVSEINLGNDGITLVFNAAFNLDPTVFGAAGETLAAVEAGGLTTGAGLERVIVLGEGESIEAIAAAAGVDLSALLQLNGLASTEGVAAGTQLVMPPPTTQPEPEPEPEPDPAESDDGGDGGEPAEDGAPAPPAGPPTATAPAPTAPPATAPAPTQPPAPSVGDCQGLGVGTANQWRAEIGVGALSSGGFGSCSWARHMAETQSFAHSGDLGGASGEVIYKGGSCGNAWGGWRNSPGHYDIITNGGMTVGDFSCVVDSGGTAWAVGRVG